VSSTFYSILSLSILAATHENALPEEVVAEALGAVASGRARVFPSWRVRLVASGVRVLPLWAGRLVLGRRPRKAMENVG